MREGRGTAAGEGGRGTEQLPSSIRELQLVREGRGTDQQPSIVWELQLVGDLENGIALHLC